MLSQSHKFHITCSRILAREKFRLNHTFA